MSTYTYDETLSSDRDVIRATLGDTDMSRPLLSDEHIAAVQSRRTTVAATIAALASELVTRFALQPVRWEADGLKVDYGERLSVWRQLATAQSGGVATGVLTYPAFHPTPTADSITRGWRPE